MRDGERLVNARIEIAANPRTLDRVLQSAIRQQLSVDPDHVGRPLQPQTFAVIQLPVDVVDNVHRPSAHPPVSVQVVEDDAVVRENDQRMRLACIHLGDEFLRHHDRPQEGQRHLAFVGLLVVHPGKAVAERSHGPFVDVRLVCAAGCGIAKPHEILQLLVQHSRHLLLGGFLLVVVQETTQSAGFDVRPQGHDEGADPTDQRDPIVRLLVPFVIEETHAVGRLGEVKSIDYNQRGQGKQGVAVGFVHLSHEVPERPDGGVLLLHGDAGPVILPSAALEAEMGCRDGHDASHEKIMFESLLGDRNLPQHMRLWPIRKGEAGLCGEMM